MAQLVLQTHNKPGPTPVATLEELPVDLSHAKQDPDTGFRAIDFPGRFHLRSSGNGGRSSGS